MLFVRLQANCLLTVTALLIHGHGCHSTVWARGKLTRTTSGKTNRSRKIWRVLVQSSRLGLVECSGAASTCDCQSSSRELERESEIGKLSGVTSYKSSHEFHGGKGPY